MSDQPLVSVVIPFYSTKKGFLNRSINSVLNQQYQNFEIIVIDDCSPIKAIDELSELLPNKKIKVFRNQANMHGAYSRNYGIEQAQGEFIALLDADDYWDNDHLSTCLKEVKDYDFIYSNIQRVIGSDIVKVEVSDVTDYDPSLMADILLDSPPQTNSFFFRKRCYPTIKFDENLKRHQDYQLFLSFCLSKYKVKKINSYTTYYLDTNYYGKVIDYSSINQFWKKYKPLTTPKKLDRFLITMVVSNLRQRKPDIFTAKTTCNLLSNDLIYKKISLAISSPLTFKMFTYTYYYLYLDLPKLPSRIKRKLKSMLCP